jgi:hypothetical protein
MMLKYLWGGGDKYLASQYCCQAVLWNYYVFFYFNMLLYNSRKKIKNLIKLKKLIFF